MCCQVQPTCMFWKRVILQFVLLIQEGSRWMTSWALGGGRYSCDTSRYWRWWGRPYWVQWPLTNTREGGSQSPSWWLERSHVHSQRHRPVVRHRQQTWNGESTWAGSSSSQNMSQQLPREQTWCWHLPHRSKSSYNSTKSPLGGPHGGGQWAQVLKYQELMEGGGGGEAARRLQRDRDPRRGSGSIRPPFKCLGLRGIFLDLVLVWTGQSLGSFLLLLLSDQWRLHQHCSEELKIK